MAQGTGRPVREELRRVRGRRRRRGPRGGHPGGRLAALALPRRAHAARLVTYIAPGMGLRTDPIQSMLRPLRPGARLCTSPPLFKEDRVDVLHDAIRRTGLATLVTLTADGLIASHVPMLLDPDPGALRHAARPPRAPQPAGTRRHRRGAGDLPGRPTPTSPRPGTKPSAQTGKVVPTWNYVAIHAYGTRRVLQRRRAAARRRHPPDRAPGDPARRTLGGDRRARRLHRHDAEGHRRFRAADHAPRRQVEDEPEPPGRGPCRRGRRSQRGRSRRRGGANSVANARCRRSTRRRPRRTR